MEGYISSGHAEVVPKDKLPRGKNSWYIPHYNKFRVAFDASEKKGGISLNDHVLCGH